MQLIKTIKMKKYILSIILLNIFSLVSVFSTNVNPISWEINQGWKFHEARLDNWYHATVPGVVQTDLMANNVINDPFLKLNERSVQWIDKEDWVYETHFDMPVDAMKQKYIIITCYGLDTYADVYLNDSIIIKADNMFRTWEANIKNFVKSSNNVLRIYFHSPVKIDLPKYDLLPYHLPVSDQSENGGLLHKQIAPFARKAPYHYGWDWGPRLLTSGIWRPIKITAWSDVIIKNTYFTQPKVNRKVAHVKELVTIETANATHAIISLTDESGKSYVRKSIKLNKGVNKTLIDFNVDNPNLWWCNGYGKSYLYHFKTVVSTNISTDQRTDRIGLRSLKVVADKDAEGRAFYFVLNGQKIFMKGADYIPCDNFLPRCTDSIYQKTIKDAASVHMNMLRVWGGGTYEDDRFYNLCDEYGILVWQDFMFACGLYPSSGHYLDNVKHEAIDNIIRLRNHPCIALWCGNNECQDGWYNWGWKQSLQKQSQVYADTVWNQFKTQYYEVLPAIIKEYDNEITYWPSSPFADYGTGSKPNMGDYHYWDVWHGKKPISEYNKVRARFFSEYGMQSFPEFESVKRFAPDSVDWDIHSEVMMSHQRGGSYANGLIETYMNNEYKKTNDFKSLLYVGQLMQGDAMKTAVEAHRRDKGYCWGTLIWQINDCWPVASWSTRDYYGRWKAAHYFMRYAMDDVLVSPIEKNDSIHIYIVSDRLKPLFGKLSIQVLKMDGVEVNKIVKDINLKANCSTDVLVLPISKVLKNADKKDVIIHATLAADKTYENNYCLEVPKNMNFPKVKIDTFIKDVKDGVEITLKSDNFARGVFLSLPGYNYFFNDNYFDLLPSKPRTIMLNTKQTSTQIKKRLKIISLSDI